MGIEGINPVEACFDESSETIDSTEERIKQVETQLSDLESDLKNFEDSGNGLRSVSEDFYKQFGFSSSDQMLEALFNELLDYSGKSYYSGEEMLNRIGEKFLRMNPVTEILRNPDDDSPSRVDNLNNALEMFIFTEFFRYNLSTYKNFQSILDNLHGVRRDSSSQLAECMNSVESDD